MKRFILAFASIFCLFSADAHAFGIPLPDFLENIMKKVRTSYEKYAEIEQETNKVIKGNIEKLTSMSESIGELRAEVEGKIEDAENIAKDPASFALKVPGFVADNLHGGNLEEASEEAVVYDSDLTNDQYMEKYRILDNLERQKSADLYALTYVRRMEIVEEGLNKKSPKLTSKQAAYRAINMRVPEIVKRISYITIFETMSGEPYYFHNLANFSFHKGEKEDK